MHKNCMFVWPCSFLTVALQWPYKGLKPKKIQTYIITHAQELHVWVAFQFPYSGLTVAVYTGLKQNKSQTYIIIPAQDCMFFWLPILKSESSDVTVC